VTNQAHFVAVRASSTRLNEALMNKPATKEPSMDEILSSIRQIIADDDAAAAPVPAPRSGLAAAPAARPAPEPLALSAAQMLPPAAKSELSPVPRPEPPSADFASMLAGLDEAAPDVSLPMAEMPTGEPELVDPEDIAFEPEEDEPEPAPPPMIAAAPPVARAPEPRVEPRPAPRPAASVAQAAPMPDPTLSRDMADELLAPTTDAAVQGAMSRLSMMSAGGIGGMTVEAMIREMLKPMLKDWLDENLPALVERVVEKEIARISRGVK
jgi:cell pole-organizing protein PopZ